MTGWWGLFNRTWVLVALAGLLAVACTQAVAPSIPDAASTAVPTPSVPPPTPAPTPSPSPSPTPAPEVTLVIVNGVLIDGTGAPPVPDAYVVISGDRIIEVGAGDPPPHGNAEVIDAGGATIMPGIIDAHNHTTRLTGGGAGSGVNPWELQKWLKSGVTTLRDVASAPGLLPVVAPEVEELMAYGQSPRVVWAGPMITTAGGYPLSVPRYAGVGDPVSGPDAGREYVRILHEQGATIIKLGLDKGLYSDLGWPLLSLDEISAITDEAHSRGLLVTAHVTSADEVELALAGGVDNLAHTPIEWLSDDLVARMLDRGMATVSTVTIWRTNGHIGVQNAVRYAKAGGTLALGTDYGCCSQSPGIEVLLAEMRALIHGGLAPMEVLVAATRNGAQVSNLGGELGTIEPGRIADIIVVSGDPLADINVLRHVSAVVLGGQVVR